MPEKKSPIPSSINPAANRAAATDDQSEKEQEKKRAAEAAGLIPEPIHEPSAPTVGRKKTEEEIKQEQLIQETHNPQVEEMRAPAKVEQQPGNHPLSLEDLGLDEKTTKEEIQKTHEILANEELHDKRKAEIMLEYDALKKSRDELFAEKKQKLKIASQNPYDKMHTDDFEKLAQAGLLTPDTAALLREYKNTQMAIKQKPTVERTADDSRQLSNISSKLNRVTEQLRPLILKKREETAQKNEEDEKKINEEYGKQIGKNFDDLTQIIRDPIFEEVMEERRRLKEAQQEKYKEQQTKLFIKKVGNLEKLQGPPAKNLKELLGKDILDQLHKAREENTPLSRLKFAEVRNQMRDLMMEGKINKISDVVPLVRSIYYKGGKKQRYWQTWNEANDADLINSVDDKKESGHAAILKLSALRDQHDVFLFLFGTRPKEGGKPRATDSFWDTYDQYKKLKDYLANNKTAKAQKIQDEYKKTRAKDDEFLKNKKEKIEQKIKLIEEQTKKAEELLEKDKESVPVTFPKLVYKNSQGKLVKNGELKGALKFSKLPNNAIRINKIYNGMAYPWLKEGRTLSINRLPQEVKEAIINAYAMAAARKKMFASTEKPKNVRKRPRGRRGSKEKDYKGQKAEREAAKKNKKASNKERRAKIKANKNYQK